MTGPNIAAGNPTVATFPMAIAKPEAKPAFCNPTSMAIVRQSFSGRLVSLPPQYPKIKPMMFWIKQARTNSGPTDNKASRPFAVIMMIIKPILIIDIRGNFSWNQGHLSPITRL